MRWLDGTIYSMQMSLSKLWVMVKDWEACCCCYCCLVTESVVSDSFATPWTIACQVPLSMGFPRQEFWSGLPFYLGIFPTQGSNPHLLHWQADSLLQTFELQTSKDVSVHSHAQLHKLVHMSGIRCHLHASSTSVQYCIESSSIVSLFQAQDVLKQAQTHW